MSNENIGKEANKLAEQELLDQKIKEIKGYILKTLERIEQVKKNKESIEEELRILKLDLEDLRNGKIDKIQERIDKSSVARAVTVVPRDIYRGWPTVIPIYPTTPWITLTSGTYNVLSGTGTTISNCNSVSSSVTYGSSGSYTLTNGNSVKVVKTFYF